MQTRSWELSCWFIESFAAGYSSTWKEPNLQWLLVPKQKKHPKRRKSRLLNNQNQAEMKLIKKQSLTSRKFSMSLLIHQGTIYLKVAPNQVVMMKVVVVVVFALAHADVLCGHFGVARTLDIIKSLWFSGQKWYKDIKKFVQCCPVCQKIRGLPSEPSEILSTHSNQSSWTSSVHCQKQKGYKLWWVDRFSHYVVLVPTKDDKAKTAAESFWNFWICSFGIFLRRLQQMEAHLTRRRNSGNLKMLHHISCPGHPEGHGAVERMNFVVEQIIRAHLIKTPSWPELVKAAAAAAFCN